MSLKVEIFKLARRASLSARKSAEKHGVLKAYVCIYESIRKPFYELLKPRGICRIKAQGMIFYVNSKDYVVSSELMTYGVWEKAETEFILKFLKPGMNFLDIGANIGYYSLLSARAVGLDGAVHAFEPEPGNFELLSKNISANKLKNIYPLNKAVSNKEEMKQLFLSAANYGAHSFAEGNVPLGVEGSVSVSTLRLDDYWREHGRGKIDFIKMDTQGAEGDILEGAEKVLEESSPVILMEFWPYGLRGFGREPQTVLSLLEKYGYVIRVFEDGKTMEFKNFKDIICYADEHSYATLFCFKKSGEIKVS